MGWWVRHSLGPSNNTALYGFSSGQVATNNLGHLAVARRVDLTHKSKHTCME